MFQVFQACSHVCAVLSGIVCTIFLCCFMTLRDAERFGGFSPADERLAEQAGTYGLS
jgi:hypothetical protein